MAHAADRNDDPTYYKNQFPINTRVTVRAFGSVDRAHDAKSGYVLALGQSHALIAFEGAPRQKCEWLPCLNLVRVAERRP